MRAAARLTARELQIVKLVATGARNLEIKENMAEFDLRQTYGGTHLSVPIVEWRGFVNSSGHELRPVVEMEICIASKRLRTQVNLNDRSGVAFPMLIGRRVLRGHFVVDVGRRSRLPARCPEVRAK